MNKSFALWFGLAFTAAVVLLIVGILLYVFTAPESPQPLCGQQVLGGMGVSEGSRPLGFEGVDVGAIYYTYKNRKAAERVLTQYRKCYPNADVAVMADGGVDFADLKDRFYLSHYEYSENLSVKWSTAEKAGLWLDRLDRAIQTVKQRWILILEDDVELKRRFRKAPEAQAWGGKPTELLISTELSAYIASIRTGMRGERAQEINTFTSLTGTRYGYSCCGGVLIDGDFWRKWYDSAQALEFCRYARVPARLMLC